MKTHTGRGGNGAEEPGHAFIPKVCFPAVPAQRALPATPVLFPDIISFEILKVVSLHCGSPYQQ